MIKSPPLTVQENSIHIGGFLITKVDFFFKRKFPSSLFIKIFYPYNSIIFPPLREEINKGKMGK
jgi:hypothetical protein